MLNKQGDYTQLCTIVELGSIFLFETIVMGALSMNINWKKVHVFYVFNL